MKIRCLISNTCAAVIVAFSLFGCSDYDNGFTDKEIAFQEAFKKQFGEIDPEQDWNLATRGTLHANFNEETNVKIYSKNPLAQGVVLMADYNISSPSDLGFDMPKGTDKVFVQAVSDKKTIANGYVDIIANEGEVAQMSDEENEVPEISTIDFDKTIELKVFQKFTIGNYGGPITNTYKLYSFKNNYVKTSTPHPWKVGDYRKILSTYYVTNSDGAEEEREGVFKEGRDNWKKWMKGGEGVKKLQDNAYITTSEPTPISLTFNYRNTSETDNKFAYFYFTTDDISTIKISDIKLFNLIDQPTNSGDQTSLDYITYYDNKSSSIMQSSITDMDDNQFIQGTTFHLVYFGEEGSSSNSQPFTSTPTISYEFPEDVHIGFAVIQSRGKDGTQPNANGTDYVWFSIADLNPMATDWLLHKDAYGGENNISAATTFYLDGTVFLGFEDCPTDTEKESEGIQTSDYNDLLFWISGAIDDVDDVDPDPDTEIQGQGWIISAEDLGDTDDIDYNDVVIEVRHVSGSADGEYVYVTPLAAGGTLASYLYFNDRLVGSSYGLSGEIHALLDNNYKEELTSGEYTPLNVKSTQTTKGEPIRVHVGQNFSLASNVVGATEPNDNMGGFNIRVVPQGRKRSEVTLEKLQRIQNSESTGEAPFVICTPNSWSRDIIKGKDKYIRSGFYRWPKEQYAITNAYNEKDHSFEEWVANKDQATDWYNYPDEDNTCAPGEISEKEYNESEIEPDVPTEMVPEKEYFYDINHGLSCPDQNYYKVDLSDLSNYTIPIGYDIEFTIQLSDATNSQMLLFDGENTDWYSNLVAKSDDSYKSETTHIIIATYGNLSTMISNGCCTLRYENYTGKTITIESVTIKLVQK